MDFGLAQSLENGMKTSCIQTPPNSRFIKLDETHLEFCRRNHCAAFLMAFFASWHDWKIRNDCYYKRANDIAEAHGDGRPNSENAYLFFTTADLVNGLLGLFGKKAIIDGLELLVQLKVITIHKNPNPRYHFDKTKYFKFYPEVVNEWLLVADDESLIHSNEMQPVDLIDNPKIEYGLTKNAQPSSENSQPSRQNRQAITNNTNHATNKNKITNACEDLLFDGNHLQKETTINLVDAIVDTLIRKGMPASRFNHDAILAIKKLQETGATIIHFIEGHDISCRATKNNDFAINYLIKAVESVLIKSKQTTNKNIVTEFPLSNINSLGKSDFHNAENWAADLL